MDGTHIQALSTHSLNRLRFAFCLYTVLDITKDWTAITMSPRQLVFGAAENSRTSWQRPC
jgi:hypothetical protein